MAQRVVDVDDADNLGQQAQLLAADAIRIAASVEPLVMVSDDGTNPRSRRDLAAHQVAYCRVRAHNLELEVRERRLLQQKVGRNCMLADVVQERSQPDRRDLMGIQPDSRPEPRCRLSEPPAMLGYVPREAGSAADAGPPAHTGGRERFRSTRPYGQHLPHNARPGCRLAVVPNECHP